MTDATLHWTNKAGAWLSIGASPGALLIGAAIAARHDGPAPLIAIIIGLCLMAALTYFQGLIGLKPPIGHDANLTRVLPAYVNPITQRVLGALLAFSMVGWFGFNVGLGGAAVAALLRLPDAVGVLLLGMVVLAVVLGGLTRWNRVALLTASASIVLIGLVALELAAPILPVTTAPGSLDLLAVDIAGFVGFVAVFSVRAPDFTFGLQTRRDLAYCVLSMLIPVGLAALAGVGLQRGTGSTDLVGTLAGPDGLLIGNLFVALAVTGPAFTTVFSGALALQTFFNLKNRVAMIVVAVPGLLLAAARFDRQIVPWLSLLGALLPPFVVAMATEALLRRRGWTARTVPLWTWGTGASAALVLTLLGQPLAVLVGLVVTAGLVLVWVMWTQPARLEPTRV